MSGPSHLGDKAQEDEDLRVFPILAQLIGSKLLAKVTAQRLRWFFSDMQYLISSLNLLANTYSIP